MLILVSLMQAMAGVLQACAIAQWSPRPFRAFMRRMDDVGLPRRSPVAALFLLPIISSFPSPISLLGPFHDYVLINRTKEVFAMYSKTVMDHFRSPRNVGVIENADAKGEVGNPLCGDMMTHLSQNQRGSHRRYQVPDLRMRCGHCRIQHAHRNGQRKEPRRGQEDHQQRRGRSPRGPAEEQASLLQPGGRCAAPGHKGLRSQEIRASRGKNPRGRSCTSTRTGKRAIVPTAIPSFPRG